MRHIDRLVIKAKKADQTKSERLIQAFITTTDDNVFIADCRLWNGKKGKGTRSIISEHELEQGAIEAINRIADEDPNNKSVIVIYGEYDLEN